MVEATGAPIVEYFAALDDPRIDRTKRYKLLDIVTIAICGTICGADNWVDIELFGNCKEEWFKSFLELPNGIPSHDTFGDGGKAKLYLFQADVANPLRHWIMA